MAELFAEPLMVACFDETSISEIFKGMVYPGVANFASSAAMAMSQLATSWHPAAVAKPLTSAITGTSTS